MPPPPFLECSPVKPAVLARFPFSWRALVLAPLPIPILLAFLLTFSSAGGNKLFSLIFFGALAAIVSYGTTIFLFLPCVFLASFIVRLNAWLTGILGFALGLIAYLPISRVSWQSSGVDSGPPPDTYLHYLSTNFFSEGWIFFASGLITALLYHLLAKRPRLIPP